MSKKFDVRKMTDSQKQAVENAKYAATKSSAVLQQFAADVLSRVARDGEKGQVNTAGVFILSAIILIAFSMVSAAGAGSGIGNFLSSALFGG